MIFYLIPIAIGLLLSFYEVKFNSLTSKSSSFRNIFIFITAIIFCGGYMTGSDWVKYELLYDNASLSGFMDYTHEKGFYMLMLIFKKIGFEFFPFLITIKFIIFYIVVSFLLKNFKSFYLPFTIFLLSNALFLFVDNPFRFMIAFGVVILSYKYLFERNFLPFLLLIILAATFHISSIIIILLYLLPSLRKLSYRLIIAYFTLFIVLTPVLIGDIILKYFPQLIVFFKTYYHRMYLIDYDPFTIGKFVYATFFILTVYNKDLIIKQYKYGDKIFTLTIAFFFIDLIGYIIPTFFRLKLYLAPIFYLSMTTIILYNIKYKLLLRFFLISYFLITTIRGFYSTYVYIPYSNYFTSLFQIEQPYFYRSKYNKEKFYERTGSWPEYFGEELN